MYLLQTSECPAEHGCIMYRDRGRARTPGKGLSLVNPTGTHQEGCRSTPLGSMVIRSLGRREAPVLKSLPFRRSGSEMRKIIAMIRYHNDRVIWS